MEEVSLPPLARCHHYINLTNGVEAVPRLQALALPYAFLRLPSTRCEQQQFEALVNDLDANLLMRLALGQWCGLDAMLWAGVAPLPCRAAKPADTGANTAPNAAPPRSCLVHDFGSRNKKRGAPRAVWYGLEFVRYALRSLWLDERGAAYLRGYSVAGVFDQHIAAFSTATKK